MRQSYVYIMINKINTVLYVGVTDNLIKRVYQHKQKLASGFTSKYNINKLVYYEIYEDMNAQSRFGNSNLTRNILKSFT